MFVSLSAHHLWKTLMSSECFKPVRLLLGWTARLLRRGAGPAGVLTGPSLCHLHPSDRHFGHPSDPLSPLNSGHSQRLSPGNPKISPYAYFHAISYSPELTPCFKSSRPCKLARQVTEGLEQNEVSTRHPLINRYEALSLSCSRVCTVH